MWCEGGRDSILVGMLLLLLLFCGSFDVMVAVWCWDDMVVILQCSGNFGVGSCSGDNFKQTETNRTDVTEKTAKK